MIDSHDYRVEIVGSGEKTGFLSATADSLPELQVGSPPEFGGPERIWNPEHLFVASIATCLMTTFRSIAARSGVEVLDYTDEAVGHLRRDEDGLYSIINRDPPAVESRLIRIEDRSCAASDRESGDCLISRSVRSEVILEARIRQAEPVGL